MSFLQAEYTIFGLIPDTLVGPIAKKVASFLEIY